MVRFCLNGSWTMTDGADVSVEGKIPGSVYSFLLDAGQMGDPYYRAQELDALKLMEKDYTFTKVFAADAAVLNSQHQVLRFEGIDTLAIVSLNGAELGRPDNMHITWEYDVKGILKEGENTLEVKILSPTKYIAEEDEKYHLGGSTDAMKGFSHLRKAHCMFGWDWGPRLPDGGIWKNVLLEGWEQSRIEEVKILQRHMIADCGSVASSGKDAGAEFGKDASAAAACAVLHDAMGAPDHAGAARNGSICVDLTVCAEQSGDLPVSVELICPDGSVLPMENGKALHIEKPELWWPNGLGEQPLYEVRCSLTDGGQTQTVTKKIGLRTMTMRRDPDEWGEKFAMEVNGQTVFSMGADYIPEDNILSRMNPERTKALLDICKESHFNVIRVWGGGFYPFDWFYDQCDELGLVVWQDCMFACANYRLTDDFVASIRTEITQNVRRIRHHASLGLWCGNNEMEQFAVMREYDGDDITAADYLIQNEFIIPEIIHREDPDAFYWPSSPSSGGKFIKPWDPDKGDVHYWEVWHAGKPFTDYRRYCFRYLSEFGFQSFPCIETVKSFTKEEDRNIFSYVMEMHQRNAGANGNILRYLSDTYLYPTSFEGILYASQLLQMDAIRYGVEHFRRNRGQDRCMGAVYWQLNDIWPVASWASVDYYLRWKALQYAAVRFFAPVLVSCEEDGLVAQGRKCITEPAPVISRARLNVSNETWDEVEDEVVWELRDPGSKVLESGIFPVKVGPFDAVWSEEMDFSSYDPRMVHLSFRLKERPGEGSVLFCAPKHYCFEDPQLSLAVDGDGVVTVTAGAYARSVEVYSEDGYIRTDDNFFDMEKGSRTLRVLEGPRTGLKVRSVYDIR